MKKNNVILSLMILIMMISVLAVVPAKAADQAGRWGIGLHGGLYKLGLTNHSDIWTIGWLGNADLKYGVSSKFSLGLEGNFMQTYLYDCCNPGDQAGLSFTKVKDGPRQRGYIAGLLGEYHFMPDKGWSPFISFGTGMYFWKWTDKSGKTLVSADPSLAETGIPPRALDTTCYYLRDQELYAMGGLGLEFFPSKSLSFEVGTKFRYLTHLFTNFKDSRKIVGTKANQLDLPKGLTEVYAGLTLYFGGKKECPPLTCQATGSLEGGSSLEMRFNGSADGGCPSYSYKWDFGDGSSSDDQNPSHSYKTAGRYVARMTVTDSKGNNCEENVSVGCPPITSTASANPTSGTVPLTVQFNAAVNGGCPPYTYSWDFGDGGSSSEQRPSHVIEQVGNYTAQLTVTDAEGTRRQASVSYEALLLPTPDKPLVLTGVKFEFNKSILTVKADSILDMVAASLKRNQDVRVEVDGHCDWIGSDAYNQKLSERRADAVRDYLIRNGVKAENLTTRGFGKTMPIADNKTDAGRALNRRVELKRVQ